VASQADISVSHPSRLVHIGSSVGADPVRTIHSRRALRASARAERAHAYSSETVPSGTVARCTPPPRTPARVDTVCDADRIGPVSASKNCAVV
jgi:hypothetical protein